MSTILSGLFWGGLVALVVLAYVQLRARLREWIEAPRLSDDDIARILETGSLRTEADEPLDLEEIEAEERRFWQEEEWDEAEEW